MEEASIDYPYALDLVRRLNLLVEKDIRLRSVFQHRGFNMWQGFQTTLFADAKQWTRSRKLSKTKTTPIICLKTVLAMSLMVLISFVSALYAICTRVKVLVFTEDKTDGTYQNDFRIEPLYEALHDTRSRYFEVVHSIPGRETFKKFLKRKRPLVYLEAIDFLVYPFVLFEGRRAVSLIECLDFSTFSDSERVFAMFELRKTISSMLIIRIRMAVFTFLFRCMGARMVFSIDDTRHYNECVAAANLSGIPTYAIQHGHFTKYHTGWLAMTRLVGEIMHPKHLLVWSEYWKKELIRLGTYFTEDEIRVAGPKHVVQEQDIRSGHHILVPYETDAPKHEVRTFIDKILSCGTFKIAFKLRPDMDEGKQLSEYGLTGDSDSVIVVEHTDSILREVGAVIGTYSTFLYDMVEKLKPVAILETSMDYGEGMVAHQLAEFLRQEENVCTFLPDLMSIPQDELKARRAKLVGEGAQTMAETIRGIIRTDASR